MSELYWTPRLVEAYLEEAAQTLRRLPEPQAHGFFNTWPAILRNFFELSGFAPGPARPAAPSPAQITQMEQTLLWLRPLERDDQRIVWERANGKPWKVIAYDTGIHRSTLWRRWKTAITMITAVLNAKGATTSRHRDTRQTSSNHTS